MKKIIFTQLFSITVFATAFCQDVLKQRVDKTRIQKQEPVLKDNSVNLIKVLTSPSAIVYDFTGVNICVDKIASNQNLAPRNFDNVKPLPTINADGTITNIGVVRQPLAGETNKMWDPGQTLNVFLMTEKTTAFVRNKVQLIASRWEVYANIHFNFVTVINSATIIVSFEPGKSYSKIGKDAVFNPFKDPTMNFGWLTDMTPDDEFKRVVMHEFGHALGFIHEHQSPAAGIQWDREKVYAYFALPPNSWSRADVDINLFQKYASGATNFSAYDPLSIMHYHFPASLTTNGVSGPVNQYLSSTDRSYSSLLYPFPPTAINRSGTLRTGDDCDMIDFNVEYNAANVNSNEVEFVLQSGSDGNRTVTWWKQIGIPLVSGAESLMQIENTSIARATININDVDKSNGISFSKAKMFGVHTPLSFKWNAFAGITGGCRVTLTWKRDSCN
jgi:hypothetical protein